MIRTPDQRLRVFVSSTLAELAEERAAVRRAVERMYLSPVMFELGARPHPPRDLYRAYLNQSDVFVGIYWQRYGWVAPGESVSGLEDEYLLADRLPQLLYIKNPAPDREPGLSMLLRRIQESDQASYRRFSTPRELEELVVQDLALMLSERFDGGGDRARVDEPRLPLPTPLTRTIGRSREIDEIVALLDGDTRLVTLTGLGGVGKTRLAVAVAHVIDDRPGAEVYFVPLASVSSPALVLSAVADQVGARGATGSGPFDSLVDYFARRRALLVLDNLEQVVAVGPDLARLLELAPGLRVLATSRQALRVLGEHEFPAGPLELPGEDATPEEIGEAASVELLLERARERGLSLDLTPASSRALGELCRRLGGLPLAIELAVPRLRLLGPEALLDRLDSTLDLPSAGADLPSRQRTLRAALSWSYELLDADERSLLARLGVFRGGATLDAVEAVCAQADGAVDTALAGLLDKSLLHVDEPTPGGELRISMLEPVRDFALEQLDDRGETVETLRRHLDYFAGLGREAQPFLCGPRQREWASRFDAERANVRAAAATGLEAGDFGVVLTLVWDTLVYYYIRDATDEPRQWLTEVERSAAGLSRAEEALLDVGLLIVGKPTGDPGAGGLLDEATGIFDQNGLMLEAAVSCHYLGLHHWHEDRRTTAFGMLGEASQRYAALDHDWGVALVEMTLGAALASVGRREDARAHFRRSLERSRRIDNRHEVAQALHGLALVDALDGQLDDAADELDEAARLVLADRSATAATYCLEALAAIQLAGGKPADAVRTMAASRTTRRRRMIPEWTAAADAAEPVLTTARRAMGAASFDEHWRAGADEDVDVFDLLSGSLASLGRPAEPERVPTQVR